MGRRHFLAQLLGLPFLSLGAKAEEPKKKMLKIMMKSAWGSEEARHEYILAYVPHGNNRNASYHKVEVRTTRQGVTSKTRQGYYTGPLVIPAKQ